MIANHEAGLIGTWLAFGVPPVVACIPAEWFTDEDARIIWGRLQDGASVAGAVRAAAPRRAGVLRWCLKAIDQTFAWNVRWHAHGVWRGYHERIGWAAYSRWLIDHERGRPHEAPIVWPAWEAAAIDAAPTARAARALVDERFNHAAWASDEQLLYILSARIDARRCQEYREPKATFT